MTPIPTEDTTVTGACSYLDVIPRGEDKPCTATRHDHLPITAVSRALHLIGAVHDHGPDDVARILHPDLTRDDLLALAVTLAAMVPDEYTPVELLAWNDSRYTTTRPPVDQQPPLFPAVAVTRQLRPHGTHAAFVRHRKAGEHPCDPCWHGEREYQRNRMRSTRRDALEGMTG